MRINKKIIPIILLGALFLTIGCSDYYTEIEMLTEGRGGFNDEIEIEVYHEEDGWFTEPEKLITLKHSNIESTNYWAWEDIEEGDEIILKPKATENTQTQASEEPTDAEVGEADCSEDYCSLEQLLEYTLHHATELETNQTTEIEGKLIPMDKPTDDEIQNTLNDMGDKNLSEYNLKEDWATSRDLIDVEWSDQVEGLIKGADKGIHIPEGGLPGPGPNTINIAKGELEGTTYYNITYTPQEEEIKTATPTDQIIRYEVWEADGSDPCPIGIHDQPGLPDWCLRMHHRIEEDRWSYYSRPQEIYTLKKIVGETPPWDEYNNPTEYYQEEFGFIASVDEDEIEYKDLEDDGEAKITINDHTAIIPILE